MNEIANLCEKVGADAEMVRIGISSDSRIGNKFLFPGLGYGGSCFPKDIKALIRIGESLGCDMSIIKSVDNRNKMQRTNFLNKLFNHFNNDISGKTFAIWGLSFKPKTDDMREAPSINIINALLNANAKVKAYDPKAIENCKKIFGNKITYCKNPYDVFINADAMLLLTEWNEFRRPDFDKIKDLMKDYVIFDGRNLYNDTKLKEKGFTYYQIGKI
jgi:UDPglucose 6-dehydrogenase